MNDQEQLIHRFYEAFQRQDHEGMAQCYHRDVTFSDPVFQNLRGWKASAMWRMLCERAQDFSLEFREISADTTSGRAFWEADYLFSKTGNKVHNQIWAQFKFRDGLIVEHIDVFDLRKWMGMALGFKGKVLGLLPPARAAVSRQAMASLDQYLDKKNLKAENFANG